MTRPHKDPGDFVLALVRMQKREARKKKKDEDGR
jgi:hypothetical protein